MARHGSYNLGSKKGLQRDLSHSFILLQIHAQNNNSVLFSSYILQLQPNNSTCNKSSSFLQTNPIFY